MYLYNSLKVKETEKHFTKKSPTTLFNKYKQYLYPNPSIALNSYGKNFEHIDLFIDWYSSLINKRVCFNKKSMACFSTIPFTMDKNREDSYVEAGQFLLNMGFSLDFINFLKPPSKAEMLALLNDKKFVQYLLNNNIHYVYVGGFVNQIDQTTEEKLLYSLHLNKFVPDKNVVNKGSCLLLGITVVDKGLPKIGNEYKHVLDHVLYLKSLDPHVLRQMEEMRLQEEEDNRILEEIKRSYYQSCNELLEKEKRKLEKAQQKIKCKKYEQSEKEKKEREKNKALEKAKQQRQKFPNRGDKCQFVSLTLENGEVHTFKLLEPESVRNEIEDVGFVSKFFDDDNQKTMCDFLKWKKCLF